MSSQTSSSQCTPSVPSTFAISCGSATTAVVPNGSTSRANSSTSSFDDSRCMCASMNPGTTKRPDASSVSSPSYSPSPATWPSTTATSVSSHSRVKTESTRPPRTTRSAGSSPRATASRRERDAPIGREPYPSPRGRPDAPHPRRGAAPEGGASRRAADPGRHGRDGRAQLRPRAAGGRAQPERGRGAARLVARRTARSGSAPGSPTPRSSTGSCASCCPRSPRRRAPSARRRSATAARSAATSAPPRRPATRCRRSLVEGAEVECASVRGHARACRSASSSPA